MRKYLFHLLKNYWRRFCTFSHRHSFQLLFTFYDSFWGLIFHIFWPTTIYAQSIVYIQWKELKFILQHHNVKSMLWIKTQLNGHNNRVLSLAFGLVTTHWFSKSWTHQKQKKISIFDLTYYVLWHAKVSCCCNCCYVYRSLTTNNVLLVQLVFIFGIIFRERIVSFLSCCTSCIW